LPLKKDANILVVGPTGNLLSVMNGGWSVTWQGDDESLYPQDKLTVFEALQKRGSGRVDYVGGKAFADPPDIEKAVAEAEKYDYIVLALGEKPYTETFGNIGSLDIEPRQAVLANAMFATGKPVILLLLQGRPRIVTEIAERAQVVLLGFLPGMEGGEAIADIILIRAIPTISSCTTTSPARLSR
jgi:beta-glucosidase